MRMLTPLMIARSMRVLHAIYPEDFDRTDVVLLAGWHIEAAAATLRRTINIDSVKRGTVGQLAPEIGRAGLIRAYRMDAMSAIIAQVRRGTCAVLWPNLRRIRRVGLIASFLLTSSVFAQNVVASSADLKANIAQMASETPAEVVSEVACIAAGAGSRSS